MKTEVMLATAVICVAVTACGPSKEEIAAKAEADAVAAFVVSAKERATRDLFDPASAEFRDLSVAKLEDGRRMLCGAINANNRYGAKVGFSSFISGNGKENDGAITAVISQDFLSPEAAQPCIKRWQGRPNLTDSLAPGEVRDLKANGCWEDDEFHIGFWVDTWADVCKTAKPYIEPPAPKPDEKT